jgi:hypothetical protein
VSPVEEVRAFFPVLRTNAPRWTEHSAFVLGAHTPRWTPHSFASVSPERLRLIVRTLFGDSGSIEDAWPRAVVILHEPLNHVVEFTHSVEVPAKQLSLSLGGSFAPSKVLTDFWVRGVTAFAQRGNVSLSSLDLASTETEIQQNLQSY